MLCIKVRATNIQWESGRLDVDQNNEPIGVPAIEMDVIVFADDAGDWSINAHEIVATELQNETGVDVLSFVFSVISSGFL